MVMRKRQGTNALSMCRRNEWKWSLTWFVVIVEPYVLSLSPMCLTHVEVYGRAWPTASQWWASSRRGSSQRPDNGDPQWVG